MSVFDDVSQKLKQENLMDYSTVLDFSSGIISRSNKLSVCSLGFVSFASLISIEEISFNGQDCRHSRHCFQYNIKFWFKPSLNVTTF